MLMANVANVFTKLYGNVYNKQSMFSLPNRTFAHQLHCGLFSTGFIIWRDLNAFKAKTNWNEIFMHSIVIAFESIKDVVYT